jgi:hypothetical protein
MIFIMSLVILCNVFTCYSMQPSSTFKQLNLRTQIMISHSAEEGSGNSQLRLLFDLEANCLHCVIGKGMQVEKSFPIPFIKTPSETVTDVSVYGFDFVKPGVLFAVILAKKQISNDSVFFMSIDLAKKSHMVWEGKSFGKFTEFIACLRDKQVEIMVESVCVGKAVNDYSRSNLKICVEQPESSIENLVTLFAHAAYSKNSL